MIRQRNARKTRNIFLRRVNSVNYVVNAVDSFFEKI